MLHKEEYEKIVLILGAIEPKNDPLHKLIEKLNLKHKKIVSTSTDYVGEYRKHYLAMIRELYKQTFFPNVNDFKRHPRDVGQRLRANVSYTKEQLETFRFIIGSDYLRATELFAKTIQQELFQGYLYLQEENNPNETILQIPFSKKQNHSM